MHRVSRINEPERAGASFLPIMTVEAALYQKRPI
jgi:hypothetical protein